MKQAQAENSEAGQGNLAESWPGPLVSLTAALLLVIGGRLPFSTDLLSHQQYDDNSPYVPGGNADSGKVNLELLRLLYYLNGTVDSVEIIDFLSDTEIQQYLSKTMGRYDMIPTGAYMALEDKSYIDPSVGRPTVITIRRRRSGTSRVSPIRTVISIIMTSPISMRTPSSSVPQLSVM